MQVRKPPRVIAELPRWVPPPGLIGFLVLLVAMFAVSYRIGGAVGPVAPGMHSTVTDIHDEPAPHDGGMGDMHSGGAG
ncbi:hypothetical protein OOK13_04510 [Streptomyces sp. NBC_00378]|nr:hypothetical protein [Streptomyces sp. NBC_00378]